MATVLTYVTQMREMLRAPSTATSTNWTTAQLVVFFQRGCYATERQLVLRDVNWNIAEGDVSLVSGTSIYAMPVADDRFRTVPLMEYNFGGTRYTIYPLEGGWQSVSEFVGPNPVPVYGAGGYRYLLIQNGNTASFKLVPTPQETSANAIHVTYEKSVIPAAGFNVAGSDTLDMPDEWAEYAMWRGLAYATQQDEENPGYFFNTAQTILKELLEMWESRSKGAGQPRKVLLDSIGY